MDASSLSPVATGILVKAEEESLVRTESFTMEDNFQNDKMSDENIPWNMDSDVWGMSQSHDNEIRYTIQQLRTVHAHCVEEICSTIAVFTFSMECICIM